MTMNIDAETGRPTDDFPPGTMGQISYLRLIQLLVASGEIKDTEKITHLRLTDRFLIYRVESL